MTHFIANIPGTMPQPMHNTAMTPDEMKRIINETLGKPVAELLEQTKGMAAVAKRLNADIAEIEADQKRRGIYGLAERQAMTANAAGPAQCTLPE
jgi:hypothetical protein